MQQIKWIVTKKHKLLHTKQIVIFATNCYIFTHFVIYWNIPQYHGGYWIQGGIEFKRVLNLKGYWIYNPIESTTVLNLQPYWIYNKKNTPIEFLGVLNLFYKIANSYTRSITNQSGQINNQHKNLSCRLTAKLSLPIFLQSFIHIK